MKGKWGMASLSTSAPRSEQAKTVLELVQDLAGLWGLDRDGAVKFTGNVPFKEATLLKLNCDKALIYLNWHSTLHYEECVRYIADWYGAYYIQKDADMYRLTAGQIEAYMKSAESQKLDWVL